jgi:hypothetical protein
MSAGSIAAARQRLSLPWAAQQSCATSLDAYLAIGLTPGLDRTSGRRPGGPIPRKRPVGSGVWAWRRADATEVARTVGARTVGARTVGARLTGGLTFGCLTLLERTVNGQPGLVAQEDGVTTTVFAFDIAGDRIKHIWAVRNPDKLRSWTGS